MPNNPPLGPPGVVPENDDDPAGLLENNPELGTYYFLPPILENKPAPDVGFVLVRPPNVSFGAY